MDTLARILHGRRIIIAAPASGVWDDEDRSVQLVLDDGTTVRFEQPNEVLVWRA